MEYREGVDLYRTILLSEGNNLYSEEALPLSHSQYGFTFNYLSFLLAKILEIDISLTLLRIINTVFTFLTSLLIGYSIYQNSTSLPKSITGSLIIFSSLLNQYMLLALPNTMGMFFFLSSIIYPYYKNFSKPSLLIGTILGAIAFYTKIYYLAGIIFLVPYLWVFVSWRKGLYLSVLVCAIISLSLATSILIFPTYIDNTIILSLNHSKYEIGHLIGQIKYYLKMNWALIIILITSALINVYVKHQNKGVIYYFVHLFKKVGLFYYYLFSCFLLLVISLGGNKGAFAQYFIELLSPFLIITTFSIKTKHKISSFLILLGLLNACTIFYQFTSDVSFENNINEFNKIDDFLDSSKTCLASPAIASIIIYNKSDLFDTGQIEYLKDSPKDKDKLENHIDKVTKQLQNQFFDVLYLGVNNVLFDMDTIRKYYQPIDTLELIMPNQNWVINQYLTRN